MVTVIKKVANAKHPVVAKHHAKHVEAVDADHANNLVDAAEHPADHLQDLHQAKNQTADAVVAHASNFF